jgi:hypothetical protein
VKCEDKKWAIRSRKLKKENEYNAKKRTKEQTMINKTLHRNLQIGQHELH